MGIKSWSWAIILIDLDIKAPPIRSICLIRYILSASRFLPTWRLSPANSDVPSSEASMFIYSISVLNDSHISAYETENSKLVSVMQLCHHGWKLFSGKRAHLLIKSFSSFESWLVLTARSPLVQRENVGTRKQSGACIKGHLWCGGTSQQVVWFQLSLQWPVTLFSLSAWIFLFFQMPPATVCVVVGLGTKT